MKTLADIGVEKVGDMGSFLVLRKRADGAPFTLYSDLDAQIMDARRLMRIKIILAVAFALLAADWFYNTWVWYDLAVSFDAMYADLRETYHQPSFLSLRLWGKHIVWYAVLGVLLCTRYALQSLGQKVLPLFSSVIELVGKVIFVLVFIPKFQYNAVILCEPIIWCFMAAYLVLVYLHDPFVFPKKAE